MHDITVQGSVRKEGRKKFLELLFKKGFHVSERELKPLFIADKKYKGNSPEYFKVIFYPRATSCTRFPQDWLTLLDQEFKKMNTEAADLWEVMSVLPDKDSEAERMEFFSKFGADPSFCIIGSRLIGQGYPNPDGLVPFLYYKDGIGALSIGSTPPTENLVYAAKQKLTPMPPVG